MVNKVTLGLVVVLLLSAFAQTSDAQRPRRRFGSRNTLPNRRPFISPYVDLLNSDGAGFTRNYFRRVRPELEFRRNDTRLGRSVQSLQRQVNTQRQQLQSRTSQLSPSGHTTSFLNLGSYFPSGRR